MVVGSGKGAENERSSIENIQSKRYKFYGLCNVNHSVVELSSKFLQQLDMLYFIDIKPLYF